MPKQVPLPLPDQRCPAHDACYLSCKPPWRTDAEWLAAYPECAREQNGTAADCPHRSKYE